MSAYPEFKFAEGSGIAGLPPFDKINFESVANNWEMYMNELARGRLDALRKRMEVKKLPDDRREAILNKIGGFHMYDWRLHADVPYAEIVRNLVPVEEGKIGIEAFAREHLKTLAELVKLKIDRYEEEIVNSLKGGHVKEQVVREWEAMFNDIRAHPSPTKWQVTLAVLYYVASEFKGHLQKSEASLQHYLGLGMTPKRVLAKLSAVSCGRHIGGSSSSANSLGRSQRSPLRHPVIYGRS